jgi:hypothetical protein
MGKASCGVYYLRGRRPRLPVVNSGQGADREVCRPIEATYAAMQSWIYLPG